MFLKKTGSAQFNKSVDYGVLEALTRGSMIIVAVDSRSGSYDVVRCEPESEALLKKYISGNMTFDDIVARYVEEHIVPEDHKSVLERFNLSYIRNELKSNDGFSMIVRRSVGGSVGYVRAEVRRFELDSDRRFLLSVSDVDREVHMDQIRQRELEDAYRTAEKASLSKNRFIYNLSHDIRSPLNAILGYTTVAADNISDPKKLTKCLSRIDDAGHQVLNIISEIMDLNELEEGTISIKEHCLTIADIVRQVEHTVQTHIRDKKLDLLVKNRDAGNPKLVMDDAHLLRALVNLISNSARFTENGGTVTLEIAPSTSSDPDYRRYSFTIEDNGTGTDRSDVGIEIADHIIKALGGSLSIESEDGRGSRFVAVLEFKLATLEEDKQVVSDQSSQEDAARVLSGRRVLVVDDSQTSSDIAVTILSNYNVVTEVASDGNMAIDMICSNEVGYYDLILMDIEMPQMDGHETTREIRGLHRPDARTIPIVALTAEVFEQTKQEAFSAGMNEFLTKPINVAELQETLVRILR